MSLEYELEPYISALKEQKTPVRPIEMNALINTVLRIANRYIKESGSAKKDEPAECEMDAKNLDECLKHIQLSEEKIGETAEVILESAEKVLKEAGASPNIKSHCFRIMEACDYHDIVGQRLGEIRRRLIDSEAASTDAKGVLAGPTLQKDVNQDEIDRLFNT